MIDLSRRRFVALIGATAVIAATPDPRLLTRLLERIRPKRTVVPIRGTGDDIVTVVLQRSAAVSRIEGGVLPRPSGPRYLQVRRRDAEKILRFYRVPRGSAVILPV